MTCVQTILRSFEEPRIPTLSMWRTQMMETVACEKMLGRLNCQNGMTKEKLDGFGGQIC